MMDGQTIGQWIVIGIVVAFVALDKAKKLFRNSNNPKLGERISALETDMENVKEDIKEIKVKLNRKK